MIRRIWTIFSHRIGSNQSSSRLTHIWIVSLEFLFSLCTTHRRGFVFKHRLFKCNSEQISLDLGQIRLQKMVNHHCVMETLKTYISLSLPSQSNLNIMSQSFWYTWLYSQVMPYRVQCY